VKTRLSTIVFILIGAVILFVLFFPAMNHPPGQWAPQAKSQQGVVSLAVALRCYWIEYGEFPRGDTVNVLKILEAGNADGQNPRKIVFIEFRQSDLDKIGRFLDGWGRPIVIAFSDDRRQVTIKSYGKNGKDDGGQRDDIVEVITPPTTK
jgi:hypothetical protein